MNIYQQYGIAKICADMFKEAETRLKEQASEKLFGEMDIDGSDRKRIEINGVNVATLSVTEKGSGYEVTDREEFEDFMVANGLGRVHAKIKPEYLIEVIGILESEAPHTLCYEVEVPKESESLMVDIGGIFVVAGTNEPIPGVKPAKKSRYTTMRIKDKQVARGLALGMLSEAPQLLLGDGH